jgi:hypothetical protein
LLNTVIILLKKKFKKDRLPDEIISKMKSANMSKLEKIRDDIFDIDLLDDIVNYL